MLHEGAHRLNMANFVKISDRAAFSAAMIGPFTDGSCGYYLGSGSVIALVEATRPSPSKEAVGTAMAIGRAIVALTVLVWACPAWTQTHEADFPEQLAAINRCYVEHIKSGKPPAPDPWADKEFWACMESQGSLAGVPWGKNNFAAAS